MKRFINKIDNTEIISISTDLNLTVTFDFPIEVWQDLKKYYLYSISNQDFMKITIWAQDLKDSLY